MISASVGQEFRSGLARRLWFRVSPKVAIKMSAVAVAR